MHQRAVLAGGCFWGMQDLIRKQPGIVSTRVGYTGGDVPNATYRWSAPQEVIHPLCWSEDHLDGTRDGKEASQAGRDRREAAAS